MSNFRITLGRQGGTMKTTRFFIQDYAQLQAKKSFEVYFFRNPLTNLDHDLVVHADQGQILIPSLNWRGSFFQFYFEYENRLNHKFLYPNYDSLTQKDILSPQAESRLNEISEWLVQGIAVQEQLMKNLKQRYQAGFKLENRAYWEFIAGPKHPHFIQDANNVIFRRELDLSPVSELNKFYPPYGEKVYFYRKNMLQSLNEVDLLGIDRLQISHEPRYEIAICR